MPAMAVESGPAAGVIAAALAGQQLGRPNLISLDMGGTTAKASVIAGGEISVTAEYEVGGGGHANRWMHGTGHPIRVPVIDLAEVSAAPGCGSRIRTTAATSMRMIRPRRRAPGRVTSSGYPLNQLRLRWKPCSSSSASWRCCVSGTARSSSPIRLW